MLGLDDWPPWTTEATPKSRKIAARPSPAVDRDDRQGRAGPRSPPAPFVDASRIAVAGRAMLCSARRRWRRAGELGGPRLADVLRLVVEVLDGDPAHVAERQPVADDEVRALVVDVDLERPRRRRRPAPTRRSTRGGRGSRRRRAARGRRLGAGTSSRSRSPRRRGRRACSASGRPSRRSRAAPTGVLPVRCRSAPWNRRYRPCPPESTTPASRRIGSRLGVLATDFSAASTVAARTASMSLSRSAAVDRRRRRLADDRQDRALDRLGDRAVGGLRALRQRVGEVQAVEPRLARRGPRPCPGRSGW